MDMATRVANAVAIKCLKATREKLEQGWSKGWFAFDASGNKVDSHSKEAVSYCLLGGVTAGIIEVGLVLDSDCIITSVSCYVREAIEKTVDSLGCHVVPAYNDHPDRTKEEILSVIDQTIARIQSETNG